jgi:tRNA (cytidine/uridine-2'-O-)-methyltransferase
MALHVALIQPQIPPNTGNIARLCAATDSPLHLIGPLGFSLDEREVKRAGLDYWEHVDVRMWPSWDVFERELPTLGEAWFFSTKATLVLWDAPLGATDDVVLVFGRETTGLPAGLRASYSDRLVTVPMVSSFVRSLNLSTSVGIATYETLRQRRARGA